MKQALLQKGKIIIEEIPSPAISDNEILVRTAYSLISTGTELSGISTSKESLLTRAMHQPHNVKKALKMASEKGLINTYKIIKGMLDFGTAIGYSSAGEVVKVGKNITDIKIGDLIACSGAGIANHAEYCAVPRMLASKIPEGLSTRQACSVTIGAIAMQGVRQANVKFGETVAVIGLGLIGQITCQILKSAGCRVIGIDTNEKRVSLAKNTGTEWGLTPSKIHEAVKITGGFGVDATIITASTESDEPIKSAMEITRRKGTVVVVGAIGLHLQRNPWYEKEIDLKISCSYGPGRYDPTYEEEMLDYPLPYVRWTENRNMEEYLKMLAEGKVNFLSLEPEEYPLSEAQLAYERLKSTRPLAMMFKYVTEEKSEEKRLTLNPVKHSGNRINIALIGAGAFASTTHLPNLKKLNGEFNLIAIASKKGLTAKQFAKQYGAEYCTAEYEEVLKDPKIHAVMIATRHDMHAKLTLEALKAGKAVFVEKPLAVNSEELAQIKKFFKDTTHAPILTVGFNRRFSPFAIKIKELLAKRRNPLIAYYRANAGYLPPDHWTQKQAQGGRIIGEGCHFLDLFQFWTGSAPAKVSVTSINPATKDVISQDNLCATIKYKDGSVCTLVYTGQGSKGLPKEYAEIHCGGVSYILNDYRELIVKGSGGSMKKFSQDKGHFAELKAFAKGVKEGTFPIPLEEIFAVTETSFEINEKAVNG